ncbi:hypothetical protein DXG01_005233 [Tephrocybe rancida]|nr:hypothetical protein DXG01_005233 [Tephrocybe rancida]
MQPLEPVHPTHKDFSFEALVQERIKDGFGLNDPFARDPFSSPLSSAPTSRAVSPVPLVPEHSPSSPLSSAPMSRAASPVPPGTGRPPTLTSHTLLPDRERSAVKDAERWKFGLSLFSTMEELRLLGASLG